MIKQNLDYTKAKEEDKENGIAINQLTDNIDKAQKDMEEIKSKKSYSDYEYQELANKKALSQADLDMRQKTERDKIMPILTDLEETVNSLLEDTKKKKADGEKKKLRIIEREKVRGETDIKLEKAKDEHEKMQEEYIAAQQKPLSINKLLEEDKHKYNTVEDEYNKLKTKNEDFKEKIASSNKEYTELQNFKDKAESDKRDFAIKNSKLSKEFEELQRISHELQMEAVESNEKKKEIARMKEIEQNTKKEFLEDKNKKKKEKDGSAKVIKKVEKEIKDLDDVLKQKETEANTTLKKVLEKRSEFEKQKSIGNDLNDEIKLFTAKAANKDLAIKKLISELEEHKEEKANCEKELADYKNEESVQHESIKNLTIMKEKMARTASQANQQMRERKEELKILRLTLLDLLKKNQETKFKLDSFVAMYENVKSQRNKYVTLIQNASQTIAENKEKIKILQNEVEILRNELLEKEQKLRDLEHKLKLKKFEHEKQAKEITKKNEELGDMESQTKQQGKEVGNLQLILQGINRDIKRFTNKYEDACENRNYMGIQLIDRNDELCILYEKSNIQDSILKRGENQIKVKEEEARMLNIELADKQRELELIQKKAPDVPVLADKVVSLKAELEQEKLKVKELSEKVEDPEKNPGRIREIDTYIPDKEFLDAKIHVLEERLNSKKEGLLEKELVLEEISNLSEKLRKQALDGRKGTLELAEKINEFRAKTTELSRKMLATVAEVSMFQATAMKLEQEKQAKEKTLEEARERMARGEPPTPECETEWLRMERQVAITEEMKVNFKNYYNLLGGFDEKS